MNDWLHLARYKLTYYLHYLAESRKESRFKNFFTIAFLLLFFFGGIMFFSKIIQYIQSFTLIGELIIQRMFYLLFLVQFVLLFLSSMALAYGTLFMSREMEFLLMKPIHIKVLLWHKFSEVFIFSSWAFLFLGLPLFIAYGMTQNIDPLRYIVCVALLLVNFSVFVSACSVYGLFLIMKHFSPRFLKAVSVVLLIALGIAAYVSMTSVSEPDEFQGVNQYLSGFLKHTELSINPYNPTFWFSQIFFYVTGIARNSWVYFYLFVSLCAVMMVFLNDFFSRHFFTLWSERQSLGQSGRIKSFFLSVYGRHPSFKPFESSYFFIIKDIQQFLRDPSQLLQFGIFFGLLFIYFFNLKNMNYQLDDPFWRNLLRFLNMMTILLTVGTLLTRFIFPEFSMEGRKVWFLKMSKMWNHRLILSKTVFSFLFSCLIAVPLLYLSSHSLSVTGYDLALSLLVVLCSVFFLSMACVCLGVLFPNFSGTSSASVVSGFGGTLTLMVNLFAMTFIVGIFGTINHLDVIQKITPEQKVLFELAALCLLILLIWGSLKKLYRASLEKLNDLEI